MFSRLAFWKTKGLNPAVIYDIGANNGGWTQEARSVFPQARYEEFEANRDHARPGRHMVLLGDSEREVQFHKAVKPTCQTNTGASIYLEVTDHYRPGTYTSESLPMVPLDVYATRASLPPPDLLKLDVQGAELDVLRGAETLLQTTKCVLLEASLHRWNKDAPMIEEVIAFLAARGFEIIDIADTHFTQGYLIQVDLIFAHVSTGLRKQAFYLR